MSKVIDISRHQGKMNLSKAKKNGVSGIMMRCAYSSSKDIKFDEFITQAKKVGVPVGVYHFATWHYLSVSLNYEMAKHNLTKQANKVISYIKPHSNIKYVALDLELENNQYLCVGKRQLTELVNMYTGIIEGAGYVPLLYGSIANLNSWLNLDDVKADFWIAYYNKSGFKSDKFPSGTYGNLMRKYKSKIKMWQYSSKGVGVKYGAKSMFVDLNHCYTKLNQDKPLNAPTEVKYVEGSYTVKPNDNLTKIANKYNVTLEALIDANPHIKNPNLIHVGDKINIPSDYTKPVSKPIKVGDTVRVKKGSKTYNGKSIASFVFNNKYKVDEIKGNRAVLDLNGICTAVNIADLNRC